MRAALIANFILITAGCRTAPDNVGFWDGLRYDPVTVRVLDDSGSKPVDAARVWLLTGEHAAAYEFAKRAPQEFTRTNGPIERFGSRVFTDREGTATIVTPFSVGGGISATGKFTDGYHSVRGVLIVEKFGFDRLEARLEDFASPDTRSSNSHQLLFRVRLHKQPNKAPEPTTTAGTPRAEHESRQP